ncbi:MAG: translation elongation factor Ts [Planctomycetota bacterium]|jgi:elongation factor Ts|nr:MAG: translation elongation factor Ts [Planctomycetota bacterium]
MAEITAAAVNALRQQTSLPLMKVKQALIEAGGDSEKAIEILRSQVGKLMVSRAENATEEGRIFVKLKPDNSEAAAVEIQCESAPVAKADAFVALGDALVTQLLNGPGATTVDELLAQSTADGKSLKTMFEDVVNQIREKFVIARVIRLQGPVGAYVHHDGKTACLFQAEGTDLNTSVLRDVAMHIAAMKPTFANTDSVDPARVAEARAKLAEEAKASGKPANIIEKIVDGKMGVFYRDECGVLTEQPFAKDDSKTVRQVLAEAGLKSKAFFLWMLGR